MGLPPIRSHGPDEYRRPARRGRRGPAHQGPEEGVGHDARRQFPLLPDSTRGPAAGSRSPRPAATWRASARGPIGVTNCLNFGNPEKPEVMWQFEEAVEGLAEACRAFGIPVTGGNVSLYNDTQGASIHPTPVLGIVGLIKDVGRVVGPGFRKEGDIIVLLGETRDEIGGSQYLRIIHGRETGAGPALDLSSGEKGPGGRHRGHRAGPRPLGPRCLGRRPGRLRRRELDPEPRGARLHAGPRGGYPRRRAPFRREPVADRRQPGPVAPAGASEARGAEEGQAQRDRPGRRPGCRRAPRRPEGRPASGGTPPPSVGRNPTPGVLGPLGERSHP